MENNRLSIEQQVLGYVLTNFDYASEMFAAIKEEQLSTDQHKRLYSLMHKRLMDNKDFTWESVYADYPDETARISLEYTAELIAAAPCSHDSFISILHSLYDYITDDMRRSLPKEYDKILKEKGRKVADSYWDKQTSLIDARMHPQEKDDIHQAVLDSINQDTSKNFKTLYNNLDCILGPLSPKMLITLGARPAMGKTTLALNLLVHFIEQKKKCLFLSLEMSVPEIMKRILAGVSQIPASHLDDMNKEELEVFNKNLELLTIKDVHDEGKPANYLSIIDHSIPLKNLYKTIKKNKIEVVIIDYLQLMSTDAVDNSSYAQVSYLTRQLKLMASELNCTIIALSQLTRAADGRDDKRPTLSDFRGSGTIEQDSDKVLAIYRPSYYDKDGEVDYSGDSTYIEVLKNRQYKRGTAELVFDLNTQAFIDKED